MSGLREARVLVTGATGFVASRLIPALLDAGARVTVTARDPKDLHRRYPAAHAVASDLLDRSSLPAVLKDIDVAYYLVHSMKGPGFESKDRAAALNFIEEAEKAGVERIVYLSGLGRADQDLSTHLRSRHEVGELLASHSIPVTELRAAVVIGFGSAAFDMLRHLTHRLPLMIAPRWLSTKIQPISERDLVRYLLAAAEEENPGGIVEIGGADVLTYKDMILRYAELRGLKRAILSIPVLTPRLSSYWVDLVTPIPASIVRPLVDGLRNEVIVTDTTASERYPQVVPVGFDEAVREALERPDHGPRR